MLDLGTLPGYRGSDAFDINEHGQVVGFLVGDDWPAFLWAGGTMRKIPGIDGVGGEITINDQGQVMATDNVETWILWRSGRIRHKGSGNATALNERGQVTITDWDGLAAVWDKGKTTRLPLLPGDDGGAALALNERNQIVGLSGRLDTTESDLSYWKCHAVMWTWQPAR